MDNLPFRHTEDALAYGAHATPKQIRQLAVKRRKLLAQSERRAGENNLQAAFDLAVQAQLCREAIEASEAG